MKTLILSIVFLIFLASCTQTEEAETSLENTISIGVVDSVESKILGENRKIWVHVPNTMGNIAFSDTRYPVLYLLDGDGHFYSVMGLMKQLSTSNGNTILPEMIIVGIPNTDRTRDLTHSHVASMFGDSTFSRTSGGGHKFTEFLSDELMPYIDGKYPTTSHKTLIGHSFGGLFALNTLVHYPDLFNNYLAIDPSVWWDDRKVLKEAKEILPRENYSNKFLYIGVANTMGEGMDTLTVQSDTNPMTDHIRAILEFSKFVENNPQNDLSFDWDYFPEDSHGSVPLISEYEGLRFFFSWYDFREANKLFQPDSLLSTAEAIAIVNTHYERVSEKFGYEVLPNETLINEFGYSFMGSSMEKAKAFLQMNIDNYPKSANAYDSMGDYFLAESDTIHAIEYFEKAVELGDLDYSKQKISDLNKKD